MWDSWRKKLGLDGTAPPPAKQERARELAALIEASEQALAELEAESHALATRAAELARTKDPASATELASVRATLEDRRDRLTSLRVAHDEASALARTLGPIALRPAPEAAPAPVREPAREPVLEAKPEGKPPAEPTPASPKADSGRTKIDFAALAHRAREVAGRTGKSVASFLQLGVDPKILLDLHQFEEAIDLCDRQIANNPSDAHARDAKGTALGKLGRPAEAIVEYDHAIRLRRSFTLAWSNRARAKLALGDSAGARADAEEAMRLGPGLKLEIALEPEFVACSRNKRTRLDEQAALTDLGHAIALSSALVLARRERAALALERGLFDLALADANALVEKNPRDATSLRLRATVRLARRELDLALADATAAIGLDARSPDGFFVRHRIHTAKGDVTTAESDLEQAAALEAHAGLGLVRRAEARLEAGDDAAALALLDDAVVALRKRFAKLAGLNAWTVRLDVPRALVLRSRARLGLGQIDAALTDLAEAAELWGDNPEIPALRASALLERDPEQAFALAEALVVRGHVPALGIRARAAIALGDFSAARYDLDALVRRRPLDATALASRGLVRHLEGDVAGGREDLAAALELAGRGRTEGDAGSPISRAGFMLRDPDQNLDALDLPSRLERLADLGVITPAEAAEARR